MLGVKRFYKVAFRASQLDEILKLIPNDIMEGKKLEKEAILAPPRFITTLARIRTRGIDYGNSKWTMHNVFISCFCIHRPIGSR